MAGATLTARLDDGDARGALARAAAVTRPPERLLKPIGEVLVRNTRSRFEDERAPDGSAWAALSPAYAPLKRGPGILRESGLRGGLFATINAQVAGEELRVGSNRAYAAIHQFGGVIRPRAGGVLRFRTVNGLVAVRSVTIPARPYLGLSAADQEDILDVAEGAYARAIAGAGGPSRG